MTRKTEASEPKTSRTAKNPSGKKNPSPVRPENRRKKTRSSKAIINKPAEIEQLRARLAEAEETMRAIRNGEVDALVVAKPGGDQVFTLKGAEHVYRVLVEEMNEGAATLNSESTVLYCNNALVSMLGITLEKMMGSSFRRHLSPEYLPAFDQFIRGSLHSSAKAEVLLTKEKGGAVPVLLSGRKLSAGEGVIWISIVVADLTARKKAEEALLKANDLLEARVSERTAQLVSKQLELKKQNQELQEAQYELKASREKYSDLFESAPVGYFTIDIKGVIKEINVTGAKQLGVGKPFLLGKRFSDFMAEDGDRQVYSSHRRGTFTKQSLQTCILKLRRHDGSIFFAQIESTAFEDVDDRAGFIRTAVIDITERKQAEAALQDSEQQFRLIAETSTDVIFQIDANGTVTYISPAVTRFGYSPYGMTGTRFTRYAPEREQLKGVNAFQRVISGETINLLELELLNADGTSFVAELNMAPIMSGKMVVGVQGTARDITERKVAEESISRSNRLLDAVVNNTHLLMACLDPEFNFIWVNRAYAESDGKDAACFPGKNHFDLYPHAENKAIFRRVVETGTPYFIQAKPFEYRDHPERGITYWDWGLIPIVDSSGKVDMLVLTLLDITERMRGEDRTRRHNVILDGIGRILSAALTSATEEDLGLVCLAVAEEVTGSKFGFIAEIREDGLLHNIAISNPGWAVCTMYDKTGHRRPPGCFKLHGLYGPVLTQGKPLIANDPANHPCSIGLPEGHPPLCAFLGAPLLYNGKTMGMVAVANRENGYTVEELDALVSLSDAIVQAFMRRRAEDALRQSEERFRSIFSQSPIGISVYNSEGKLLQLNRAAMAIFGVARIDDVIGMDLFKSPTIAREKKTMLIQGEQVREEIIYDFESIKAAGFYKTLKNGCAYFSRLITPLKTELQEKPGGYLVQTQDITERKRNEARVIQQKTILEEINRIFRDTIDCDSEEELGNICLAAAQRLTKSGFGFIAELGRDGLLHDVAINGAAGAHDESEARSLPGRLVKGLCSRVLEEGRPFLTNYPRFHPEETDSGRGSRDVTAFLGVPLLQSGKTIGIVGLANKEGGYRTEDRVAVEALAAAVVELFLRRRAEEALRKNQERMREYVKMLEFAPLMVRNMNEEIILWNKGMEGIYGYSSVEAIGQKSRRLLKTVFPETEAHIMREVKSAGKWKGELKQVTRDGRNIIVASLWILYKNDEGKETAVIEVNNDITLLRIAEEAVHKLNGELESRVKERTTDLARTITALQNEVAYRRKAEKALRESRFNLAKAQSLAHIGSWSYDFLSGKFASSDEFFNIFGMKRSDDRIIDIRTLQDSIHPEDREKVREKVAELMAAGKAKPLDYRIIRPDGEGRVVWTEAEMVLDAEARPVSIIGTVHDITERKHVEEELTRLATAIESAADALVVTEPANGVIQYVNPAFEKMTGYTRGEVVGRDLHMLDSGRHDEAFYRQLRETLALKGSWTGRLVQKRKDGTLYEEECTYSLVKNSAGEVINYISIKRDVTEKTRLESIAQAVDTMNNIGYIFAGVSHEIGNPVNAMGMTLDILMRKLDSLPGEKIKQYVNHLATQVRSIEYLLKNLKNFNMYESLELKSVDISRFLETFLSMVRKDFDAKGIVVDCIVEPAAKAVCADPRALQQVLLNILTNAADALAGCEGPRITIAVSESGGKMRLRIEDNGKGIEENRLDQLFKPFYTTKPRGTGLGLVIIRKMMAKMQGTVEITSSLNVGTVVVLQIPSSEN